MCIYYSKKQPIYKRCELVDRLFSCVRHGTRQSPKQASCWHWGNLPTHICTDNQPSSKVTPVWQKQEQKTKQCISLHYMFPWHTNTLSFQTIQKSSLLYRHLRGCYSCSASLQCDILYWSIFFRLFFISKLEYDKKNNNWNVLLTPVVEHYKKLLNCTKERNETGPQIN